MTGATTFRRRALPFLALAALTRPLLAGTRDLAVTCDTTLGSALRKAAAAYMAHTGIHVFVFPTGPGLILPQLIRNIQNDIVVTQTMILEQAVTAGVVSTAPSAQWRNQLVIAGRRDVAALDHSFAVADPSPASDVDGPAVLTRLDIKPTHIVGAVDTDEVAFLLNIGAAQAGLLHLTDVRAGGDLAVIQTVPSHVQPPLLYAASVTRLSSRPDPDDFVTFLASKEGSAILFAAGLEKIA
jgi:ABC-type molybdate transport system substrate-binding protein